MRSLRFASDSSASSTAGQRLTAGRGSAISSAGVSEVVLMGDGFSPPLPRLIEVVDLAVGVDGALSSGRQAAAEPLRPARFSRAATAAA
jgi:hypothetical protein